MSTEQYEFRPATADELPAMNAVLRYVFADTEPTDDATQKPETLLPEWTHCAFHDGQVVAASGGYPFKMRLNGQAVAVDGVTAVGTDPTHRRRGLVRRLITDLMHRAHDNEVPVSLLWASMGAIYQRFGYGLAATQFNYRFDPRFAQFQFGDTSVGHCRRLEKDEALPIVKELFKRFSSPRNLMIHRAPVVWELLYRPFEKRNVQSVVHYDDAGEPDAYCLYRVKGFDREDAGPWQELSIGDFGWLDINGWRGVWEYLTSHDLVGRINWFNVPEDDPAPGLLLEPRQLNRRAGDGVWLRVNDVESTLAARPYGVAGEVVVDVPADDICPWNPGRYRVASSGETHEVTRANGEDADLVVSMNGLASLVCGQSNASWLDQIGRIEVADKRKLPFIDAFFSTRYRPACTQNF